MSGNLAQQFSLDFDKHAGLPAVANTTYHQHQKPLWLSLYLPQLALDLKKTSTTNPSLIIDEIKGRYTIYSACDIAKKWGITPGMPLNAAYALCSVLNTHQRDKKKEAEKLKNIATWLLQFTPSVSIDAENHCIQLEVRASLTLFGGLLLLQQKILTDFKKIHPYEIKLAIAPTPLASQILARFFDKQIAIENESSLRSALGKLPISALSIDNKIQHKLHNIGVKTLKELWRLPRDSLARRFGKSLIQHLDKLLGTRSDPLLIHQAPITFERHIELPYETSNYKLVFLSAVQLLDQLEVFLTQRDAAVTTFSFRLFHFDKSTYDINIGLRQCSRKANHFSSLLKERLNYLKLHAAVCEIHLIVNEIQPFIPHNYDIFSSHLATPHSISKQNDPEWQNLLEQLQNRFGLHAIQHLQAVNDHRPEFAWRYQHHGKTQAITNNKLRPLWLLPTPKNLKQEKNQPFYLGPLTALHGPERIESGWWEDKEIRRDYYIARDTTYRKLWIFRDLMQNRWYLHGYF